MDRTNALLAVLIILVAVFGYCGCWALCEIAEGLNKALQRSKNGNTQ